MEKKNSRKTANYYYRLHRVKKDLLCSIAETAKAAFYWFGTYYGTFTFGEVYKGRTMGDILLIGNGFDLAHGLHTSYNDFLYVIKNWTSISTMYRSIRDGNGINESESLGKYLKNVSAMDDAMIQLFGKIIERNAWIQYYSKCEAEIDGWIDFEREIYPVMKLFRKVFSQNRYLVMTHGKAEAEICIPKEEFNNSEINTSELWSTYFKFDHKSIVVQQQYSSKQYGILKKKILNSLRKSFDEFILAFEIYLHEFVYKEKNVPIIDQIRRINPKYVISFNYTLTEKLYGVKEEYKLHIYGHSLDETDEDILRYLIGKTDEQGRLNLNSKQIVIYYYDASDYEQKVVNLIKLYGRPIVEENIEKEIFKFVKTDNMPINKNCK